MLAIRPVGIRRIAISRILRRRDKTRTHVGNDKFTRLLVKVTTAATKVTVDLHYFRNLRCVIPTCKRIATRNPRLRRLRKRYEERISKNASLPGSRIGVAVRRDIIRSKERITHISRSSSRHNRQIGSSNCIGVRRLYIAKENTVDNLRYAFYNRNSAAATLAHCHVVCKCAITYRNSRVR